jgi:hypothetical protein
LVPEPPDQSRGRLGMPLERREQLVTPGGKAFGSRSVAMSVKV